MIAVLADFWPVSATAPAPKPRTQPLLMGDILTARGGEPEFLIRWREDRSAIEKDAGR